MLQREWDWENYEEVESDSWTFNCLLQGLSLKLPSHMSLTTIHKSHEWCAAVFFKKKYKQKSKDQLNVDENWVARPVRDGKCYSRCLGFIV